MDVVIPVRAASRNDVAWPVILGGQKDDETGRGGRPSSPADAAVERVGQATARARLRARSLTSTTSPPPDR